MNEQRKKKYETPVTKHVQVEVENSICAASVTPEKGQDVATDGCEIDFTKGDSTWE